jgi:hypothetical protein
MSAALQAALLPHYPSITAGLQDNAGKPGPIKADIAGEFFLLFPHADGNGGMADLQDRGPRHRGERCIMCGARNPSPPHRPQEWTCSLTCRREQHEHYN